MADLRPVTTPLDLIWLADAVDQVKKARCAMRRNMARLLLGVATACTACKEAPSTHMQGTGAIVATDARATLYADTLPDCASCSLLLTPVGSFGSATDSVLLRDIPVVVRDGAGYLYAAVPFASDHEILTFAPDGRLAATMGRSGTGPGEYRYVVSLSLFGDSILVVAHDGRYITEYTLDAGLVSTVAVTPLVTGPVIKRPLSGYVMTGRIRRSAGIVEHPIHFVSDHGAVVSSAGTDDVTSPNGPRVRVLGRGDAGGVWVGETGIYRLERIDSSGQVVRVIGIQTPPSFFSRTFMSREEADLARSEARSRRNVTAQLASRPRRLPSPPPFTMTSIGTLYGHLIVVTTVAAPAWEEAEVSYEAGGELKFHPSIVPHIYQTVVDVIEPESGALLARERVPGYGSLANDSILATIHADELGVLTGKLHQITFRRQE